jgi:hypothetical protein
MPDWDPYRYPPPPDGIEPLDVEAVSRAAGGCFVLFLVFVVVVAVVGGLVNLASAASGLIKPAPTSEPQGGQIQMFPVPVGRHNFNLSQSADGYTVTLDVIEVAPDGSLTVTETVQNTSANNHSWCVSDGGRTKIATAEYAFYPSAWTTSTGGQETLGACEQLAAGASMEVSLSFRALYNDNETFTFYDDPFDFDNLSLAN